MGAGGMGTGMLLAASGTPCGNIAVAAAAAGATAPPSGQAIPVQQLAHEGRGLAALRDGHWRAAGRVRGAARSGGASQWGQRRGRSGRWRCPAQGPSWGVPGYCPQPGDRRARRWHRLLLRVLLQRASKGGAAGGPGALGRRRPAAIQPVASARGRSSAGGGGCGRYYGGAETPAGCSPAELQCRSQPWPVAPSTSPSGAAHGHPPRQQPVLRAVWVGEGSPHDSLI